MLYSITFFPSCLNDLETINFKQQIKTNEQ